MSHLKREATQYGNEARKAANGNFLVIANFAPSVKDKALKFTQK